MSDEGEDFTEQEGHGSYGEVPVLPFESDDPQFTLGVEIGRLWEMCARIPEDFDYHLHYENTEMAMRVLEVQKRDYVAEALVDGEWLLLRVMVRAL